MHTSRFVNGRGLLTCKRKHLSGLAKFLCFGFPSTRHKSIIRIQNTACCSQSEGGNMMVGRLRPSISAVHPTMRRHAGYSDRWAGALEISLRALRREEKRGHIN